MYRTQEEKQEYIDKIFSDKSLFEWEVLHVSSHYDRLEIMQILSETLVRDRLKYEINFLYMKSYKDFNFSQIVNILFHEIANEWLSFATEILYCSKKDAVLEIQDKTRVKFIHSIATLYYEKYRGEIFQEVADTFLELVGSVKNDKNINEFIEEVLQSDLIKNKQILSMHNFSQLYRRVKAAQNIKNSDIISVKMKISELQESYKNSKLDIDKRQRLLKLLNRSKIELEKLNHLGLDKFDAGISRFKETMVQSMLGMSHSS